MDRTITPRRRLSGYGYLTRAKVRSGRWPWHPREGQVPVPVLEILKETREPTLYEAFRRHFARLWGPSAPLGTRAQPAAQKRAQVTVASP